MGGLAVFTILAGYVALAIWLIKETPRRWKLATLAVLVLVPGADELFVHYVLMPRVCADAGFKLLESVSPEGGLLADTNPTYLRETRLAFVESEIEPARVLLWPRGMGWDGAIAAAGKEGAGPILHLSLQNGKDVWETRQLPSAKYLFRIDLGAGPSRYMGREIRSQEIRIEDRQSGQVISRVRDHAVRSGWVLQFLARFSDAGPPAFSSCLPNDRFVRDKLIVPTFK
jgi:hypothetical protein